MSVYNMATGSVYSDTDAIAEITGYQYGDRANLIRDDNALDTSESYKVGKESGSGRIRCHYDPTDTGQLTLRTGEEITVNIYPDPSQPGGFAGDWYIYGTVTVEEFSITGENDGLVEAEIGFKGLLAEGEVT